MAAADLKNTEYKYRWCRELTDVGIGWDFVVVGEIDDDEDSEYEWILKFARDNRSKNISFYDDLPLTNMKAGDFYHEILHRTDIKTRDEIKAYRIKREQAKTINYQREGVAPTARAQAIIDHVQAQAAQSRLDSYRKQRQQVEADLKYQHLLDDPEGKRKIATETLRLQLLDGIITAYEHDQAVKELGGYPEWTTQPDQLIKPKVAKKVK